MGDSGLWPLIISVLCIVLTTFFSVLNLALRHPSWSRLEEAFAAKKKPQHSQFIRQHLARLIYTTAVFRLFVNLGLLLSLIYQFTASVFGDHPDGFFDNHPQHLGQTQGDDDLIKLFWDFAGAGVSGVAAYFGDALA